MTRELVYGRRPVREVLRGPREVLELWASERATRSEAWLREVERPRVQTKLERDLSEAAGTRDHQGVVAWCEPFRYADAFEVAAGPAPLLACLDQVSDPRNLGAVIRSAEGAGASGVVRDLTQGVGSGLRDPSQTLAGEASLPTMNAAGAPCMMGE